MESIGDYISISLPFIIHRRYSSKEHLYDDAFRNGCGIDSKLICLQLPC